MTLIHFCISIVQGTEVETLKVQLYWRRVVVINDGER